MTEPPDGERASACCKVGRIIKEFELVGIDENLAAKWRGESAERKSVRALTDEFNKRLLQAGLDKGDIDYLEGEVNNTYSLLTDDDVTEGVKVNVRRALKRGNVEIEAIESAFVSHQTIYNHLTDCLGIQKPQTETQDPVDKAAGEMFSLQNRTVAVVDSKIERLRDGGELALSDFDVYVDVNVRCKSCGTRLELGNLLREGGCSCQMEN
jgi:hypothetical protein